MNFGRMKDRELADHGLAVADYVFKKVTPQVQGGKPEWDKPSMTELNEFKEVMVDFDEAVKKAATDRSVANTAQKDGMRKRAEEVYRAFEIRFLTLPPCTETDRRSMGYPQPDETISEATKPTSWPLMSWDHNTPGRIIGRGVDSESAKHAKPHNAGRIQHRYHVYAVGETLPDPETVNIEKELERDAFWSDPRKPMDLIFGNEYSDCKMVHAVRYLGETAEAGEGPWSPVTIEIIP